MPTDGKGKGNTVQDAAIARDILDAAQQQQRNWDNAAIADQQSSSEEMVCAKTKLRNMVAPHLAAQALRAEGERRAKEEATPTQADEQKFTLEYRQAHEIVWAFIPSLGDDACGVSAENPTCSCSIYEYYKNERMVERPVESADESRLIDCIHFQNEMIPPGFAMKLAAATRERDEARAELVKLEAAHKDLKIERDQACFERDELHKAVNRCSKDLALSYSLQRQTTSERDEARKQLDIIKAERDALAKACKELCVMRVHGNGADLDEAIEAIEKVLTRLQGGAS